MKHKLKIISVILTLVFCLSTLTLSAFAVDESDSPNESESYESLNSEPSESEPDFSSNNSENTDEPTEPSSGLSSDPTENTDDITEPTEAQTNETYPPYSDPDENTYPLVTDEPDYYPDRENIASDNIETIDVEQDSADNDVLTDDDWEQIRLSFSEDPEVGDVDVDDFGFIKNNKNKTNDGYWIIIVGVLLIVCSVACLTAFVLMTKKASEMKKRIRKVTRRKTISAKDYDDYGDSYSPRSSRDRNSRR